MVLTRWSPFATLYPTATYAPLDVQRTDAGYRVQAALPGFKPEDVEVTLDHGALTIDARRSEDRKTEDGRYLRREVFSGSVRRRLVLPAEVKADDISATLENGVLTVDVKHTPEGQAVRIPVGAAAALPEPEPAPAAAE